MAESDFGTNRHHIKNSEGREITDLYLRQYIQCTCRKDKGFIGEETRRLAFRYFASDEFLAPLAAKGLNACQVADCAAIHPFWMQHGVTPMYTAAQKRRIAERDGVTLTGGKSDMDVIRKRQAELTEAAAWKARREALLNWDKTQLKKMLSMDPDALPEPLSTMIRELKADWAKLQLELKAEAATK